MFANRRITEGDERPMLFTYLGKIKIKKVYERKKEDTDNKDTTNDILTELVELMIYYKMSYPTGQKDECTIQIKEGSNEIITSDSIYRLSDEVFCMCTYLVIEQLLIYIK